MHAIDDTSNSCAYVTVAKKDKEVKLRKFDIKIEGQEDRRFG